MADETVSPKTAEQQIRDALQKLANALTDAAGLEVVTRIQVIDPQNPSALQVSEKPVAHTKILLDGDRDQLIPVVVEADGAVNVPAAVYELHKQSVQEALEYRKHILATLVDFVKPRR